MDVSEHRPYCTIELIAEGRAERCPGGPCPFWQDGCVLDRVADELAERRELAQFLVELRRNLERTTADDPEAARAAFHRRLAVGKE